MMKLSRRLLALLAIAILAFFYLAISGVSLALTEEWKNLGQERVFSSERVGEGVVIGRAWVEPTAFRQRERFRCWISLENRSSFPATDLEFATTQILAPAVEEGPHGPGELEARANDALAAALRQGRRGAVAARTPTPAAGNATSSLTLPAHNRVTFWISLEAPPAAGQYDVLLVYSWKQGAEWKDNSVVLGPLQVLSWLDQLERVGATLTGLIKDLGLPIILLVLPLLWAKLEKEREARRQQAEHLAEAERQQAEHLAEAKRQEVERHTQQARETWARMLLISHRNATLHYLPLLSTLRDLADRLWLRDFPAWQDEAFFQLMTLLVLMKRLRDKAGGFYLKSRLGEDILSDLWLLLKHACQRTLGLADYTAALDEMGGAESYAAFSTSLTAVPAQRPALLRCRLAFDTWVVNPDLPLSAYAPLLRLFYYVLRYETNRSYVYWYGTVEEPPNAELARWTEQLTGGKLGHAAWKRGILAELGKYQKEARESYLYLNSRLKPE